EATVKTVEFEEFMGLNDSVKTIAFRVTDQQNNTIDHDLNYLNVKISQNHGFVETLNFYLFPDFTVRITGDRLGQHTLVGLTNPETGIQNMKWFDVFDFNAGDELHVQENITGDPQFSSIIEYEKKSMYNYLERTDYNDSIVYRCARKQSIETIYTDGSSLVINNDTVKQVVRANVAFDKLPGEPVIDSSLLHSFYMRDEEFLKKIDRSEIQQFVFNNNCWNLTEVEGCLREMNYFEGLGGPYYSCTGYVGDTEERKLVYYRKGETEWGERLVITGIPTVKTDNKVKVFPNPSKNEINILMHSNVRILSLELVDLTGNRVYQNGTVRGNNFKLDVSEFPKGIYILKIETGQGEVSQRVVIQ
ncbi:MAG: T9SS type A sorting domain-containing protein, partial [Bacteroidota bacterium]